MEEDYLQERERTSYKRRSSILKRQDSENYFDDGPRTPRRVSFAQTTIIREFCTHDDSSHHSSRSNQSSTSSADIEDVPVFLPHKAHQTDNDMSRQEPAAFAISQLSYVEEFNEDVHSRVQSHMAVSYLQNRTIHFNKLDSSEADMNMTCNVSESTGLESDLPNSALPWVLSDVQASRGVERKDDNQKLLQASDLATTGSLRFPEGQADMELTKDINFYDWLGAGKSVKKNTTSPRNSAEPYSGGLDFTRHDFTLDDMELTADLTMPSSIRPVLADIMDTKAVSLGQSAELKHSSFSLEGQENNPLLILQGLPVKEDDAPNLPGDAGDGRLNLSLESPVRKGRANEHHHLEANTSVSGIRQGSHGGKMAGGHGRRSRLVGQFPVQSLTPVEEVSGLNSSSLNSLSSSQDGLNVQKKSLLSAKSSLYKFIDCESNLSEDKQSQDAMCERKITSTPASCNINYPGAANSVEKSVCNVEMMRNDLNVEYTVPQRLEDSQREPFSLKMPQTRTVLFEDFTDGGQMEFTETCVLSNTLNMQSNNGPVLAGKHKGVLDSRDMEMVQGRSSVSIRTLNESNGTMPPGVRENNQTKTIPLDDMTSRGKDMEVTEACGLPTISSEGGSNRSICHNTQIRHGFPSSMTFGGKETKSPALSVVKRDVMSPACNVSYTDSVTSHNAQIGDKGSDSMLPMEEKNVPTKTIHFTDNSRGRDMEITESCGLSNSYTVRTSNVSAGHSVHLADRGSVPLMLEGVEDRQTRTRYMEDLSANDIEMTEACGLPSISPFNEPSLQLGRNSNYEERDSVLLSSGVTEMDHAKLMEMQNASANNRDLEIDISVSHIRQHGETGSISLPLGGKEKGHTKSLLFKGLSFDGGDMEMEVSDACGLSSISSVNAPNVNFGRSEFRGSNLLPSIDRDIEHISMVHSGSFATSNHMEKTKGYGLSSTSAANLSHCNGLTQAERECILSYSKAEEENKHMKSNDSEKSLNQKEMDLTDAGGRPTISVMNSSNTRIGNNSQLGDRSTVVTQLVEENKRNQNSSVTSSWPQDVRQSATKNNDTQLRSPMDKSVSSPGKVAQQEHVPTDQTLPSSIPTPCLEDDNDNSVSAKRLSNQFESVDQLIKSLVGSPSPSSSLKTRKSQMLAASPHAVDSSQRSLPDDFAASPELTKDTGGCLTEEHDGEEGLISNISDLLHDDVLDTHDNALQKIEEIKKDIASKQEELHTAIKENAELRKLSEKLDEQVRSAQESIETAQKECERLDEAVNEIDLQLSCLGSITEWTLRKQSKAELHFGFLFNTLVLEVSLASSGSQQRQAIASLCLRSRLAGASKPWAKLCHQLALSSINCADIKSNYSSKDKLSLILLEVSRIVCKCKQLSTELRQTHLKHRLSISGSRLDIYILNRKLRRKIKVTTSFEPPITYPDVQLTWAVSAELGEIRAEQVMQAMEKVNPGERYLTRQLQAAEDTLGHQRK